MKVKVSSMRDLRISKGFGVRYKQHNLDTHKDCWRKTQNAKIQVKKKDLASPKKY